MPDWPRIVGLYDDLLRFTASPVVRLNRAVAVAMADGPASGLALIDELTKSGELADYHLLPATRAWTKSSSEDFSRRCRMPRCPVRRWATNR